VYCVPASIKHLGIFCRCAAPRSTWSSACYGF